MVAKDRFHDAVQRALEKDGWTIVANPHNIYWGFFRLEFTQAAVEEYKLLIVVYNSENEEIVKWIKQLNIKS